MTELDQLRADFGLVWSFWRDSGQISRAEHDCRETGRPAWSAEVRAHMGDAEWMRCCSAHFRQMAAQVESDRARSAAIRAEVRAEREAA